MSDAGTPALLPQPILSRLEAAAQRPLFRAEALDLLKAVRAHDAFPQSGLACLGLTQVYLAVAEPRDAVTWGQIATDALAAEGRIPEALTAQVAVARGHLRVRSLVDAREILRDVAASAERLFDLDADADPSPAMHRLRGSFALAAAEIRLETLDLAEAIPLYQDALEDLGDPDAANLRVAALHGLSLIAVMAQDPPTAIAHLREAARLSADRGANAERLELELVLTNQLIAAGEIGQARKLAARARERAEQASDRHMEAAFAGAEAMARTFGQEGASAVDTALDAMEAFARAGEPWGYTQMLSLVVNGQLRQGLLEDAGMTLISGAAALRAQGLPVHAELLQIQLDELRAKLGAEAFEQLTAQLMERLDSAAEREIPNEPDREEP